MNIETYKRNFSEPVEDLQNVFFQVLLHELNRYEFKTDDWIDFAQVYGQLFYEFETLWVNKAESFNGLNKSELHQFLELNSIDSFEKSFETECDDLSSLLKKIKYDQDEAYIGFINLNTYTPEKATNFPISSLFNSIKGSFPVIDHDQGVWVFNGIDIESKIPQLTSAFDDLLVKFINLDVAQYFSAYIKYGDDEEFSIQQKVAGETEAFEREWALIPDLTSWSNERIIFILRLRYCKMDGSKLNPETMRRTVNRIKKNYDS